jgi:sec-independent protein translocase protein TatA
MPIGIPELLIVLVLILVIFGPKRLPMLGRQLGGGMREFRDSITRRGGDDDEDPEAASDEERERRPELTRAEQTDVLDPRPDATRTPAGERDEPATRRGG